MKMELVELICCPQCRSALTLQDGQGQTEIQSGTLRCDRCKSSYRIKGEMPFLYVDDERWAVKDREAEGWIAMSREDGAYDSILDIDYSFVLPYYPSGTWLTVAPFFDAAIGEMALTGSETILDLGAGQGWASKYFAIRGCRTVAIDMFPDDRIGLGRGKAIMDQAGVYFERVIGDSEDLPFKDETFDIVFCNSSLHHAVDMGKAVKQVARVLKDGGRFLAIEPIIPLGQKETDAQEHIREVSYGIVESRRNLLQFYWYLWRAGLRRLSTNNLSTLNVDDTTLYRWIEGRLREIDSQGERPTNAVQRIAHNLILRMPRGYASFTTFLFAGGDVMLQARKAGVHKS